MSDEHIIDEKYYFYSPGLPFTVRKRRTRESRKNKLQQEAAISGAFFFFYSKRFNKFWGQVVCVCVSV